MSEIALKHAFDRARRVSRLDVAIDLAAEPGCGTKSTADINVIALNLLFAFVHLAGEQSDVADVMLCTRMMAAGEMDVHRTIELHARIAPLCNFLSVAFGV